MLGKSAGNRARQVTSIVCWRHLGLGTYAQVLGLGKMGKAARQAIGCWV